MDYSGSEFAAALVVSIEDVMMWHEQKSCYVSILEGFRRDS